MTRTYHQLTARYNTYFNGRESFRAGVRKSEQQFRYDYNKILPVFLYTDPDIARSITPEMDRAINKASKVITNKSITARPKEGNGLSVGKSEEFYQQNEYNRWVRESYLLAGKAHFYKHDFIPAAHAFRFIIQQYSTNSIRHEAKIWLARSYNESGRYNEARLIFNEISEDPDFPAGLNVELYSTMADYHLKQDQMPQAIINMEKALEAAEKKNQKIRYSYILAQLYERSGNFSKASDYYSRVIRTNPPYEMVFNAQINQAGVAQTGSGATSRMINQLEKMLLDEKNSDFQDQIYYALGNIYLRNNDQENAIRMYSLSVAAPGLSPSQKALSYLTLADIYFTHPDYERAHAYYDSSVMNMNQEFPNQQIIIEKSNILKALVKNTRIYKLEDSVQLLAAMSEAERNKQIDNIIARIRQEEAETRQREQLAQQSTQFRAARTAQSARQQAERSSGGSWYFYNQSAVTFGQNEFESLWGNRKLEDNWRRSNKQVISADQFAMINEEGVKTEEGEEKIADTRSREYYLKNIPLTDEALQASHKRLEEALYNMGIIYKDDFQDYERSIKAHEELISRYPEGEMSLPGYYNLHSVHLLSHNYSRADFYKDLIVSKYPGSPYASILTNTDYFREYEQQLQIAENYYKETFTLFMENEYGQVEERASYATATWPESTLIPLFEYLKTLSSGSRSNLPLFKDMLTEYISKYPKTEMAENARELIVYLNEDYPETTDQVDVAFIQDIYKPEQEGEHYFLLIVDNIQDQINRMVFNIVNFNVDNYTRLNLNVRTEPFSTNYQIIRVELFPDTPMALDYLKRFSASDEVFKEAGRDDFPLFFISRENYRIFMKDKNISSYLKFFEEEYLKR